MALDNKINKQSIFSYARACVEVARKCTLLGADGFTHTIIPSRGAAPIEEGALYYLHAVRRTALDAKQSYNALLQHIKGPLSSPLYLPFTADSCEEMIGIESRHVRTFWAKVVAAIVSGNLDDPQYRFFTYTRDYVCRVGFKSGIEDRVRSKRFVFLDTVVSGRAIIEIIDAFEAEELNECHYILVVDENGTKLQPGYRRRLTLLAAEGRATLLYVGSLFTEDQGPAVSGIWCLSCPELMSVAREEVPAFQNGAIGAGVYYHEIRRRDDGSNEAVTVGIAMLNQLIWQAVQIVASPDQLMDDLAAIGQLGEAFDIDRQLGRAENMSRWFEEQTAEYLDHVHRNNLFDQATTREVASPKLLAAAVSIPKIEVSSSHALRLHFSRDEAMRLVREFRNTFV